jgi:putative DNA primase/helicase
MSVPPQVTIDIVAQAAARLGLALGRDRVWRGRCPVCSYAKHTLAMRAEGEHVALSCLACGRRAAIAAAMGLPKEFIVPFQPNRSNGARAIENWGKAAPAAGTMVEAYLRTRGIVMPIPATLRFMDRRRNWCDGRAYPAMIALVARVPGEEDDALREPATGLIASGAHYTFLANRGSDGSIGKAETEACKLTLGRLGGGGVWLTPVDQINDQLAVAEGIETALSVLQITGLPTVAALSASGMRGFRWPAQVRRLWIAADNDRAGLEAARVLRGRALRASVCASIKVPANGKNDFNDVLRSA